jgi:hypothetical protein
MFDVADNRFNDGLAHAVQSAPGFCSYHSRHALCQWIVGYLPRLASFHYCSAIGWNQHLPLWTSPWADSVSQYRASPETTSGR